MLRIYAADMGAGNTNIYWIDPTGTDPSSMTEKDGEPSGYIVYKNDNTMGVGRSGFYLLKYSDLSNLEKIKLNWKKVPTEENRTELTEYFRAWNKRLRDEQAQDFIGVDEEIWFVGCPTGGKWKRKSVRKLYKKILEDAGFKNVTIIPESNGALAYYQKEWHILDNIQSTTKVILIDLGAYSIDATLFSGGKITSYGQYLGAGLIDKMIVRAVLYGPEARYRVGKKIINDPEIVEMAKEEYEKEMREVKKAREEHKDSENETRRIFYEFLQIAARRVKEQFFSSQIDMSYNDNDEGLPQKRQDSGFSYDFGDDGPPDIMEFFFNEKMRQILMEGDSISKALGDEFADEPKEVREYIGDLTWMKTLEKFLNETADVFDLGDGDNVRIMMTGGGSLMKCVQDKISYRFPNAQVYKDKGAVKAIGYGLARWGPDKVRAMDFEKKFKKDFLQINPDMEPDDLPLFQKVSEIYVECVEDMERPFTDKAETIFSECVDGWKNYRYGSTEITDRSSKKLVDWFNATWVPSFNTKFANKVEQLKMQLNTKFENSVVDPLRLRDRLGNLITLLPPNDQDFLAHLASLHELDFKSISNKISNFFKDLCSAFANFNNEDRPGFISSIFGSSDPRGDCYNDLCEHWREKHQEEFSLSSISNNFLTRFIHHWLCVAYWYEDNPKSTNEHIFSVFVMNALIEGMEPCKKAILGKLVLEEILPEEE